MSNPTRSSSSNQDLRPPVSPWAILDQAKALPIAEREALKQPFLDAAMARPDNEWNTLARAGQSIFGYPLGTPKPVSEAQYRAMRDRAIDRWANRPFQEPDR